MLAGRPEAGVAVGAGEALSRDLQGGPGWGCRRGPNRAVLLRLRFIRKSKCFKIKGKWLVLIIHVDCCSVWGCKRGRQRCYQHSDLKRTNTCQADLCPPEIPAGRNISNFYLVTGCQARDATRLPLGVGRGLLIRLQFRNLVSE